MKCMMGVVMVVMVSSAFAAQEPVATLNPRIDAQAYLAVTQEALRHRESRRISEIDFLRMSAEPGTVVLDARSSERYRELHVEGALNLSFPDITAASLARLIPDKRTRILIYCNNNFVNADSAFPSKLPSASLNLSTFTALYNYGYRNVLELAPLIDAKQTGLKLVSSQ
jgi:phage shock protein E